MTFSELLELDKEAQGKSKTRPPQPKRRSRAQAGDGQKPEAKAAEGEAKAPVGHEATTPGHQGTMTPSMVERLRKAVKEVGKEAATYRLTQPEKEKLREIIYTYRRQGYRTSEIEIARIGLNWLVEDYREKGKRSVLHKILRALKE